MKLIECYIESFGKLKDFRYTFGPTLNIINEENGYGKSTLAVFIKSMLYGLEDTRRARLEENDRKKYMPWGSTACGGSLTFSVGTMKYRAERTFSAKAADDTFAIYDIDTGKPTAVYTHRLGEELFGIDADGFERTVFLSERKLSVKNDNKSISAKLSDLVGCDGDVGELDNAIDALEERRKYYYKKGGAGKIADTKEQITECSLQISELERIKDALPEKESKLPLLEKEIAETEKKLAEFDTGRRSLTNEKLYLTKRKEKEEAEARLLEITKFFTYATPSQSEIRTAQKSYEDYKSLYRIISYEKEKAPDAQAARKSADTAAELLGKLEERKAPVSKKLFPALLCIAVLLCGIGGAMCAAVSAAVGIPLIAVGALALAGGVALGAASARTGNTDSRDAQISAFLSSCGRSYVEKEDYASALTDIRAEALAVIAAQEQLSQKISKEEEELNYLQREADSFLSKFPTRTEDPFTEIRENLTSYEYTAQRVEALRADLAYIVREYGVSEEKLKDGILPTCEYSEAERERLEASLRTLRANLTLISQECRNDAASLDRLEELYMKRAELNDKLKEQNRRLEIIRLTKEYLSKAKEALTARYLGKTRSAFAEYTVAIANEDPERFTMDTSFALTRSEGAISKPTEAYSLGTQEFFSLAARLALVDSLYEKEQPFVILDDPFAHFDDKKCAAALRLLKKLSERKQIIYFTCSKART